MKKTDLSQVAISHLIRLIIIVTVFPLIVNSFYEVENIKVVEEVFSKSKYISITNPDRFFNSLNNFF